jgi:hypothetical protein
MMDPLGLKASLRKRMGEVDSPAAPAAAASAPSQAPFFKGPKPDAAARQKGLIEALRRRGS